MSDMFTRTRERNLHTDVEGTEIEEGETSYHKKKTTNPTEIDTERRWYLAPAGHLRVMCLYRLVTPRSPGTAVSIRRNDMLSGAVIVGEMLLHRLASMFRAMFQTEFSRGIKRKEPGLRNTCGRQLIGNTLKFPKRRGMDCTALSPQLVPA